MRGGERKLSILQNFGKGKYSHQGFLFPRATNQKNANSSTEAQCSFDGWSVLNCDSKDR